MKIKDFMPAAIRRMSKSFVFCQRVLCLNILMSFVFKRSGPLSFEAQRAKMCLSSFCLLSLSRSFVLLHAVKYESI